MAVKRTMVSLKERDQQALLALQARYHLATASDALRFALRTCDLSPAQRPAPECVQEGEGLCATTVRLEQFTEQAVRDLRESLSVVMFALELLSTGSPEALDVEARQFLSYALKGVQQMQAVLSKLPMSSRIST